MYQGKDTPSISLVDEETTNVLESINTFYVDIKGSVNKPGVYKVDDQMIVNDLIKLAGGLTKNAYTKNINLATKLKEGMVVYVYSKNELTNTTSTTTILNDAYYSYETTTTSSEVKVSGKVNINTATKEELMTVSGIGESKAIAIIDYRKNNKFNSIEDIMNVSGIGESLFAKIKEYITV
jgi:competence protein ComEA